MQKDRKTELTSILLDYYLTSSNALKVLFRSHKTWSIVLLLFTES